jgi:hypothetical protein
MKFIITTMILLASFCVHAKECFDSPRERRDYERELTGQAQSVQITSCLKANLSRENGNLDADLSALRKSNNAVYAAAQIAGLFAAAKTPMESFAAASALVSAADGASGSQNAVLGVISSPNQPDYKKTLAAIILAAISDADEKYIVLLQPALKAEDDALRAYAAGAYATLIPNAGRQYINDIIALYAFDKNFAKKAYAKAGLKDKNLSGFLKTALSGENAKTRAAAAQWAGDEGTAKTLALLLSVPQKYNDIETLSAAANGLYENYDLRKDDLRKALKAAPASNKATIATLAYSFAGIDSALISTLLQKGSVNEKINALRIVSAVSALLQKTPYFFKNPPLEEMKLTNLSLVVSLAGRDKNPAIAKSAAAAEKELYKLINKPKNK